MYRESFDYIKDSRKFIYSVILLFFLFALVGFFVSAPSFLEGRILQFIEELLTRTEGMSRWELISFIFLNNLQSSFTGMVFGVFFGVFSLLSVITNGYVLGFVASKTAASDGILTLWRILPHGIFELPALFISLGLGLRLGSFILQKRKLYSLKEYAIKSLKVFIFVIIPLLIIAALIEGSFIFFFS